MTVVSVGFWDIIPPYSGYARAVYSSLNALSLYLDEDILYLCLCKKNGNSSVKINKHFSIEYVEPLSYIHSIPIRYLQDLLIKHKSVRAIICEGDITWVYGLALARRFDAPCIWRMHASRPNALLHMAKVGGVKSLLKYPFALVHELVAYYSTDLTVTLSWKEALKLNTFDVKKAVVIEPTYIATPEQATPEPISGLQGKRFVFFVGGAYEHNVDSLNIVSSVAPKLKEILFVVAGSVANLSGNGSKISNTLLRARPSDSQLSWLYKNAFAVLIPARWGVGVNMKLVEALYHGKAIISTPIVASQLKGLTDSGGVIVINNLIDLKKVIEKVMNDDDFRRKFERRAREFYNRHLAPEKHALKMAKMMHMIKGHQRI